MLPFELLAFAYALALCIMAALNPAPARRVAALLVSGGLAATVYLVAAYAPRDLRLLAPLVYLLVGYWAPALLVRRDATLPALTRLERWLIRTDAVLRPRLPGVPLRVIGLAELAYLFCYPLVPLSLVLAWSRATPGELGHFWLLVLAAGYSCYITLPWLPSRPPRVVGAPPPEPRGVRALNALVLGRFSHGWNTFPSGHVAVASAAAIGVWQVWPAAGVGIGALGGAIGIGAAAGRYHYVVDVFAGVLVAGILAVVTRLWQIA